MNVESGITRFLLSALLLLWVGCGELRPSHDDAKDAFAELIKVKQAHQKSVADFAINWAPQYEEIIKLDTMLLLKQWRRRQLQFEYLIEHDPDRLRLRRGREGLVSFDWSQADSTFLAHDSPYYVQLEREIEEILPRIDEQKLNSPGVVSFYDSLEESVEFKSFRRVYGRDEQAIVLRYRLSAILKEEL